MLQRADKGTVVGWVERGCRCQSSDVSGRDTELGEELVMYGHILEGPFLTITVTGWKFVLFKDA